MAEAVPVFELGVFGCRLASRAAIPSEPPSLKRDQGQQHYRRRKTEMIAVVLDFLSLAVVIL